MEKVVEKLFEKAKLLKNWGFLLLIFGKFYFVETHFSLAMLDETISILLCILS